MNINFSDIVLCFASIADNCKLANRSVWHVIETVRMVLSLVVGVPGLIIKLMTIFQTHNTFLHILQAFATCTCIAIAGLKRAVLPGISVDQDFGLVYSSMADFEGIKLVGNVYAAL